MKSYPIYIHRKRNAEYNRVAALVENYLNGDLASKNDGIYQYKSYVVAHKLGEQPDVVREVIESIDVGHNGVTLLKGDYDKAMQALQN